MTPREELQGLIAARAELKHPAYGALATVWENIYLRDLVNAARKKAGKKLLPAAQEIPAKAVAQANKVLTTDEKEDVARPHRKEALARVDTYEQQKKVYDDAIAALIPRIPPESGPRLLQINWYSGGAYRSAGAHYDRVLVEMRRDELAEAFPDIRLSIIDTGGGRSLMALVADEVDVEVLRRTHPWPLREQVRQCWARGVNPRVYQPFLPHGYEAEQEIDFLGNDLRKK